MKTQGFTLIELLAVIVILAIIALIATPIVLGIIDDTKESAQIRSAEMYLKGVANAVMKENLEQEGNFKPTECSITSEGNLDCDDKEGILEVEVDGEKPKNGTITFEEGKIKEVRLEYANAIIVKNEEGNLVYSDEESGPGSGSGSEEEETLAPGLYAEDGTIAYTWRELLDNGNLYVDDNGTLWTTDNPIYESSGDLVLDESVKKIGGSTFAGFQIKKLVIPTSVTKMDCNAISGLNNNIEIIYNGTLDEWKNIVFDSEGIECNYLRPLEKEPYEYTYDDILKINCKDTIVTFNRVGEIIDNDMDEIALLNLAPGLYDENNNLLVSWENLTSKQYYEVKYTDSITGDQKSGAIINVNNGVLSTNVDHVLIDNYSSSLLNGKLVVGNNVTSLDSSAFAFCQNLSAIILSNTVTYIDGYAFDVLSYNSKLKTIYIPSSVNSLHSDAFLVQNGYPMDTYIYCESNDKPSSWSNDWNKDFMYKFGIK